MGGAIVDDRLDLNPTEPSRVVGPADRTGIRWSDPGGRASMVGMVGDRV
jgi:hypothetical protein